MYQSKSESSRKDSNSPIKIDSFNRDLMLAYFLSNSHLNFSKEYFKMNSSYNKLPF